MPLNVRKICKDNDPRRRGYFNKETFVKLIDVLCTDGSERNASAHEPALEGSQSQVSVESEKLAKLLNDQEILTVMRRFQGDKEGFYHYDELCDIFSHFYCVRELKDSLSELGLSRAQSRRVKD